MNAELQSLLMNPVGQRLESRSARRRWEPVLGRNQDAVCIPHIFPLLQVLSEGILHIPPLVNHRILPPILHQSGQNSGIGLVIVLIDGQPIGIPTVPPHGWCGSQVLCVCQGCGECG